MLGREGDDVLTSPSSLVVVVVTGGSVYEKRKNDDNDIDDGDEDIMDASGLIHIDTVTSLLGNMFMPPFDNMIVCSSKMGTCDAS